MTDAVIKGEYADFKLVKTRNVVQMIIEVPIEQATLITTRFGIPNPNESCWVAVAKLDVTKTDVNNKALKSIQQAGILGQDVEERAAFAEGGQVGEKESEAYSLITKDIRKLAPIFKDEDPISTYTEKELKGYAKGIKEPVYRTINKNNTWLDAGNPDDILSASILINKLENIFGQYIGSLDIIAFKKRKK